MPDIGRMTSIPEAAKRSGLTAEEIRKRVRSGQIRSQQINNQIVVRLDDVADLAPNWEYERK